MPLTAKKESANNPLGNIAPAMLATSAKIEANLRFRDVHKEKQACS